MMAAKKAAAGVAARAKAKAAAKAATKAAAKSAAKLASAILKRVDDGMFGIQSAISSIVLLLLTAGHTVVTQLHPPD